MLKINKNEKEVSHVLIEKEYVVESRAKGSV